MRRRAAGELRLLVAAAAGAVGVGLVGGVAFLGAAATGCNFLAGIGDGVYVEGAPVTGGDAGAGGDGTAAGDDGSGPGDGAVDPSVCADLDKNPYHCGRCNHDCFGGACRAGVCQPVDVVRRLGGASAGGVAVAGDRVFWQTDVAVWRALVDGGAVTQLADAGTIAGLRLTRDGGGVYWNDTGLVSQGIYWRDQGGDGPLSVATSQYSYDFAVAGGAVFWTARDADTVIRTCPVGRTCALDGGVAVANEINARAIASDGTTLLWSRIDGTVRRCDAVTCAATATTIAQESADSRVVAIAEGLACWIPDLTVGPAPLRCVPLAGGGAPLNVASTFEPARALAIDATDVYWASWRPADGGGAISTIHRVPRAGGAAMTLAETAEVVDGLALDASAIYWVVTGGSVVKLAKP